MKIEQALGEMDKQRYVTAVTTLEKLERQHPYSEFNEKAKLMEIYANYRIGKFDEAIMAGRAGHNVGQTLDLERAMQELSDTGRAVVWLHDVEGYTHEEIAEMMGKSVSFSKSQLARAHTKLRRTLGAGMEVG